jgi:protein O-GlcNAc transferase
MKKNVDAGAALNHAIAQYQNNQIKEAEKSCKKILADAPRHAETLHLMGVIQIRNARFKDATKFLRQAILSQNDNAHYHSNLAYALQAQGNFEEAIEFYQKALQLQPDLTEALMNLGNALRSAGKMKQAEDVLRRAHGLYPDNPDINYNLGLCLQAAGEKEQARIHYQNALQQKPLFAQAHLNLGALLHSLGETTAGIKHLQQALQIDPQLSEAYNNLGNILHDNALYPQAIEQYQQALAIAPDDDKTLYNLGFALISAERVKEALTHYEKALDLNPNNLNALSELVHRRQHICDWRDLDSLQKRIGSLLATAQELSVSPFNHLNVATLTGAQHLQAAKLYSKNFALPEDALTPHAAPRKNPKIKIGYVSADFCQHATAYLMAELFERHDRNQFETYAYCYSKDDGSAIRQRLIAGFDSFVDIRKATTKAAADRIRQDGIDILIDLKGYTGFGRPKILAYKPAPVQVNYIGYPGTMGAEWMDYIIADGVIIPEEHNNFYSEKIVRLPHSYQPNDTKRKIADTIPTRAQCGLPESGFVFCCFNNTYKIMPAVFDVWMRLLDAVPDSVFWLFEANDQVTDNLRKEAKNRGIDPARLIFAKKMDLPQHLARHACADLFLDTLPINAHTTTSDALWAGLPVLTCLGSTFAGRVAASLLQAVGLPELIVQNMADYESLALSLARDPARLANYRQKLQQNRLSSPLFDIGRYTKNLETAYQMMWQKHATKQKPDHILVADTGA